MKKYQFNKLIRSKLPERMSVEGVNVVGRNMNYSAASDRVSKQF